MKALRSSIATTRGFTLVELLVVIGIVALLISILLPSINAARSQANTTACLSNIRQVGAAILMYANASKGSLPPNLSTPAPGLYWDHDDRVGRYLRTAGNTDRTRTVLVCPADEGSVKSYAMNVWTSSRVISTIKNATTGQLWRLGMARADQIILVAEAWSILAPVAGEWQAEPYIGYVGLTPGQRFGVGGGLGPPKSSVRGPLICELPYYRHRSGSSVSAALNAPVGRVTLAYADGHAAIKNASDLASSETGTSTLDSLWSLADERLNK